MTITKVYKSYYKNLLIWGFISWEYVVVLMWSEVVFCKVCLASMFIAVTMYLRISFLILLCSSSGSQVCHFRSSCSLHHLWRGWEDDYFAWLDLSGVEWQESKIGVQSSLCASLCLFGLWVLCLALFVPNFSESGFGWVAFSTEFVSHSLRLVEH